MNHRNQEEGSACYFRSERVYNVNNLWFFSTREGVDIGPFNTKEDAQGELILFIRHVSEGCIKADAYFAKYKTK
ncbi:MAG: DUF6316 family protein [Porticoccus sp.]